MSKELSITISDETWEAFKDAIAGQDSSREVDCEATAEWCMYQAIHNKIKQHKHPATGLTKQQMTHHRRGELAAKQWLFTEKGAQQEEFEEAGRTWSARASKYGYIQELILRGWLSAWKEQDGSDKAL